MIGATQLYVNMTVREEAKAGRDGKRKVYNEVAVENESFRK